MNLGIVLLAFASLMQEARVENPAEKVFTSKNCGFSIAIPGPTTESFQTEQTPSGPLINKIFQFAGAEKVYTVIVADYPGELDVQFLDLFLDGVLEGYTTKAGGKLISSKKITFQGEKAREVALELQGGLMHATYFVREKRIYQILLFYTDPANDKPDEVSKFNQSFRLIKTEGNLTDGMADLTAWKEYRSEAGGYTVKILGQPKETTQDLGNGDGTVVLKMIQSIGEKGENYGVSYSPVAKTEPPQTPKVLYETVSDGAAESLKGKVISRRAIRYKGKPASEVVISLPASMPYKDGVYVARLYWVGDRLFQTVFVGPNARTASPEVREFFDSFQIDDSLLK